MDLLSMGQRPNLKDAESAFWPPTWEKPKKYEPVWLELLEVNVKPDLTAHLDDAQCFAAFLDYKQQTGLTSWHMSTSKYIAPVDQARMMLEMCWGIERGTIKTVPYHDLEAQLDESNAQLC